MMRILMVAAPWPSRFPPLAPLGWALRGDGHEVRVACGPDLLDTVGRSGHQAVVCGPALAGSGAPGPDTAVAAADLMADELVTFARSWRPDLVVHEPLAVAGPLVAALLKVPAVRYLTGPGEVPVVAPALATLARFGLDGVDPAGALTLDPAPDALRTGAVAGRLPVREIPFKGPGEIPRWVTGPVGHRRVLVAKASAAAVVAADAVADEVVVAVAPERAAFLEDVPADVRERLRVVEHGPLPAILPTCALVVHGGGDGAVLGAAAGGVPQLVVSASPGHAALVEAAGAGLVADPSGDLAGPLRRLLSEPEFASAAQALRAELEARPAPWRAAARLEELVREPATVSGS